MQKMITFATTYDRTSNVCVVSMQRAVATDIGDYIYTLTVYIYTLTVYICTLTVYIYTRRVDSEGDGTGCHHVSVVVTDSATTLRSNVVS